MFGTLRTTFALMVMVFHLYLPVLPLGTYPVFGFYVISGYLMTLIMHETYGYTKMGIISFLANRFLRLYPLYWTAALFSILIILFFSADAVAHFHKSIYVPVTLEGIFYNLTMIFPAWLPNSINPRLVPPTWALTVELFFYVLICLGASKTLLRVFVWIVLSVGYVVFSFVVGMSWQDRYYPICAASLPFSFGSSIYFFSKSDACLKFVLRFNCRHSSAVLFILMFANLFFWMIIANTSFANLFTVGFYVNLLICSYLVFRLATGSAIARIGKKYDNRIGDYSYPIYLCHWQGGILAQLIGFQPIEVFLVPGLNIIISAFIAFLFSTISILAIDKPVQQIRSRIKASNALPSQCNPPLK